MRCSILNLINSLIFEEREGGGGEGGKMGGERGMRRSRSVS